MLLLDVRSECIDHALRLLHVLIPVPLLEAFVAVAENLLANLALCMHAGATSDTARKDTRHYSEEELPRRGGTGTGDNAESQSTGPGKPGAGR